MPTLTRDETFVNLCFVLGSGFNKLTSWYIKKKKKTCQQQDLFKFESDLFIFIRQIIFTSSS